MAMAMATPSALSLQLPNRSASTFVYSKLNHHATTPPVAFNGHRRSRNLPNLKQIQAPPHESNKFLQMGSSQNRILTAPKSVGGEGGTGPTATASTTVSRN